MTQQTSMWTIREEDGRFVVVDLFGAQGVVCNTLAGARGWIAGYGQAVADSCAADKE